MIFKRERPTINPIEAVALHIEQGFRLGIRLRLRTAWKSSEAEISQVVDLAWRLVKVEGLPILAVLDLFRDLEQIRDATAVYDALHELAESHAADTSRLQAARG